MAFAGPRSIDLREDAAERLAAGKALGVVGARDRWRLSVPTIPSSCALRGWVTLRFGERVEVVKLSAGERVRLLAAHYALRIAPRNPAAVLELASLPGWELSRPRCWNSLAIAMEHLLDAIAG